MSSVYGSWRAEEFIYAVETITSVSIGVTVAVLVRVAVVDEVTVDWM